MDSCHTTENILKYIPPYFRSGVGSKTPWGADRLVIWDPFPDESFVDLKTYLDVFPVDQFKDFFKRLLIRRYPKYLIPLLKLRNENKADSLIPLKDENELRKLLNNIGIGSRDEQEELCAYMPSRIQSFLGWIGGGGGENSYERRAEEVIANGISDFINS